MVLCGIATDASSTGAGVTRAPISYSMSSDLASLAPLPLLSRASDNHPATLASITPALHPAVSERIAHLQPFLATLPPWKVVAAFRWAHSEHINALEARAAGTALRFAASRPSFIASSLLLLSDSVAVVGALAKGRSSSPALRLPIRSVQALCLAASIRLYPIWLHTTINPADEPSRWC